MIDMNSITSHYQWWYMSWSTIIWVSNMTFSLTWKGGLMGLKTQDKLDKRAKIIATENAKKAAAKLWWWWCQ